MGFERNYLKRMGELLTFHKIINKPEDLNDKNFGASILEFQEKVDIMLDGNPQWETLWQLQFPMVLQEPKLSFIRCEADQVPGSRGDNHLWLRQDAAEKFNALRNEIIELGGIVTTAGGRRSLKEGTSTDRSVTSMHYPGLAFDLASDTGFFKPEIEPYVITLGGSGFWEVWCRVKKGDDMKMNAVYWDHWNSGTDRTKTISGKFVNLTELCAKHGFSPIRPRLSFTRPKDRKYTGCEWWHFQATDLLIPHISQFGIELLRIDEFSPESIRAMNENLWNRRQAIFHVDWL